MRSIRPKRFAPLLVLALATLACAVEPSGTTSGSGATPTSSAAVTSTTGGGATPTAAACSPPSPASGMFTHTATAASITDNYTVMGHALAFCQPKAIVFATPNWNPGGAASGVYNNHPIGVFYLPSSNRWAIFNQDKAAMPVNASFNVEFTYRSDGPVCVQAATASLISGNTARITCETGGDNTNSKLFLTPNWNSPGALVYVNHSLGVYHVGNTWYVFTQDKAAMPPGASFNIAHGGPLAFLHRATAGTIITNSTVIDNANLNGRPNAIFSVTPNWNPGANAGVYNNHNIGVWYNALVGKWAIFNQDRAAMPVGASFNVAVGVVIADI
jgi:hypothetical protein